MADFSKDGELLPYVVLLSGTHVTGKETLAASLAKDLRCPWLKGEMAHVAAMKGARSQADKGYSYSDVFGRIWLSKLSRLGLRTQDVAPLPPDPYEAAGSSDWNKKHVVSAQARCSAVISCYAMRKSARDAIRAAMSAHSIRVIFTILHITSETLSGRTLGAEEPALAARIMQTKVYDIEEPAPDEQDIVLVDSMLDVDALLLVIEDGIERHCAAIQV